MSQENQYFRTAAFGGFQKSDVLSCIEEMNRKHQSEMDQLRTRCESAEKQLEQLQEEHRDLKRSNEGLEQQHADTLEKLGEMTVAQNQAQRQHQEDQQWRQRTQQLEAQAADREARLAALQQKNQQLEDERQEYLLAKEKLPEIELCAYRRAKEIEEQALREAKAIRLQSAELIQALKRALEPVYRQSGEYLTQVEQTLRQLQQNAQHNGQELSRVMDLLDEAMMAELTKNTGEEDADRCSLGQLIEQLTCPKEKE